MERKRLRDTYSEIAQYVQSQDVVETTARELRQLLHMFEDDSEASFDFLSVAHYANEWDKWHPKRWTITVPKGDTLNVDIHGWGGCTVILTGEGDGDLSLRMEERSDAIRAGSGKGNATRQGPGDALRTDEGPGKAILVDGASDGMAITGIAAEKVFQGPWGEWAEDEETATAGATAT